MLQFQVACCPTCPKPVLCVCGLSLWQGTPGRRAARVSAAVPPAPAIDVVSTALFCAFSCVLEMMLEIRKMCYCDISRHYQQYGIKLHSGSFAFLFSETMFLQDYFYNLYLQFPFEH